MANTGNLFPRTTRLSSWSKRRRSAKWGSLSFRGSRSHCNHNLWWYLVSPPHQTLYVMVMIQPGSASNPHLWSKAYLLVSLMVFGLCNLQPSSNPFPSGVLLLSLIFLIRPTGTSLKRSHRWPAVWLEACLGANIPPVAIKQVVNESRAHGLECLLGQTWLRNLWHCCMGTPGIASKLQNRGFREREAIGFTQRHLYWSRLACHPGMNIV